MEQMATDLSSERNAAQQLDNTRMMLERQVITRFVLLHCLTQKMNFASHEIYKSLGSLEISKRHY